MTTHVGLCMKNLKNLHKKSFFKVWLVEKSSFRTRVIFHSLIVQFSNLQSVHPVLINFASFNAVTRPWYHEAVFRMYSYKTAQSSFPGKIQLWIKFERCVRFLLPVSRLRPRSMNVHQQPLFKFSSRGRFSREAPIYRSHLLSFKRTANSPKVQRYRLKSERRFLSSVSKNLREQLRNSLLQINLRKRLLWVKLADLTFYMELELITKSCWLMNVDIVLGL